MDKSVLKRMLIDFLPGICWGAVNLMAIFCSSAITSTVMLKDLKKEMQPVYCISPEVDIDEDDLSELTKEANDEN